MQNDTIAAISTPAGEGGISSIRISGTDALKIAGRIFKAANKDLNKMPGYTAAFGKVFDGDEPLDEAVALVFRAPKSYTGEDVVELSVHGGSYLITRLLRAAINAGARPAEAGEFTKRAFLNGKMSLTEAEAVMDIISARGDQALKIAEKNKSGMLSGKIKKITDRLLYLVSEISVYSDFPEDETLCIKEEDFLSALKEIKTSLEKLKDGYDTGRLVTSGINTVIIGSPNAGKSTLMNLLSKTSRSIVTPIAGTTRDIIEDTVRVGKYILHLSDTAGIHTSNDEIEKIGITAALSRLDAADLCLAVFDASVAPSASDIEILEKIKNKHSLIVLNKKDLGIKASDLYDISGIPSVSISALTGEGEKDLISGIETVLGLKSFDTNAECLSNERQYSKVLLALKYIDEAIGAISSKVTLDAVGIIIDDALSSLLELDGKKITSEVADEVFKNFCVGK